MVTRETVGGFAAWTRCFESHTRTLLTFGVANKGDVVWCVLEVSVETCLEAKVGVLTQDRRIN